MRYATVCSGIEACSAAWHPLGWQPVFFSEIEKFPSAVLAHHYPNTPNLGDMTKINGHEYRNTIDVFCGGTPCQSFSVAGLRGGLGDERGNLALTFCRLVDQIRPTWVIWENVPGVLSSNKGRDFGSILGALAHIGYGFAYRVLDAQYFGVPQRRRRVFVVGHIGGFWQPAAAVLFERGGLFGDSAPGASSGQKVTRNAGSGVDAGGWPKQVAPTLDKGFAEKYGQDNQHIDNGAGLFVPYAFRWQNNKDGIVPDTISATLRKESGTTDERSVAAYVMATGQANAEIRQGQSRALTCNHEAPIVFQPPICFTVRGGKEGGGKGYLGCENKSLTLTGVQHNYFIPKNPVHYVDGSYNPCTNVAGTLTKNPNHSLPATVQNSVVRRITPREAGRLQGFPDDYTAIYGEKTPDGPQYAAYGNSMAVPVMQWIGRRIQIVHDKISNL